MKLYYSPTACSFATRLVLEEAGIPYVDERVDLKSKKTATGADFNKICPKGYVPALELDNGRVLSEGVAIVQFLADQKPESQLAPKAGTFERVQLWEWLNYITSEVHKGFSPLFKGERVVQNPEGLGQLKAHSKEELGKKFDFLSVTLGKSPYLMGESYTVADAYLYTVLRWTTFVGIDLNRWDELSKYTKRIAERPATQRALAAEAQR